MKNACLSLIILMLLSACASKFPQPSNTNANDRQDGTRIFEATFLAHGGLKLNELKNVNVGLTGKWKQLIRRIQPLVTDYGYRVDSQERLLPQARVYAAQYTGPAGRKSVFRTPQDIQVEYNSERSDNADVLSSSALTADAFHLFLLGPLALAEWRDQARALQDAKLNGENHHRIHVTRTPGFGFSTSDEVVLWVNAETLLTKKIQITLEGHKTTQGAHVEVEFLDYVEEQGFTFPSRFFERVNAPIAIGAHAWRLTGLDINRDYTLQDLQGPEYSEEASRLAEF